MARHTARPAPASSYSRGWVEDEDPRWDGDRARLLTGVPDDLFPATLRVPGRRLPGRWWRVLDGATVACHCWLHEVPGRAVALLVAPGGGAGPYTHLSLPTTPVWFSPCLPVRVQKL
uniref:hypothetical protein n=1 Tax=Geodermatophilus chilensis TaxID=2035835 RepID=UPI0012FFFDB7